MRIAVDAMGGDRGVSVIVPGAIEGARAFGVDLALVGRRSEIDPIVQAIDLSGVDLRIVDAPDTIEMHEHPAQAIRRKPRSSIGVGLELLRDGEADALVSAGNSGAVMACALLTLGRVPGIDRPAIGAFIPTRGNPTLLLDLGAVTDPKPEHLVQMALMGTIYTRLERAVANPTVGLLSNGEEPTKGNQLVQAAFPLLESEPSITFAGNIEGTEILSGQVDVIVADGFTGNIALKVAQGTATALMEELRAEVTKTLPRKLAAMALRPALQAVRSRLDYARFGGAPLLGVNGAVIIAHGRSNERAIANAVGVGRRVAESQLIELIRAAVPEDAPA
ncbi:MAG: phosphate acyltransferase PlsX [Thermomicrobiales bacterium]